MVIKVSYDPSQLHGHSYANRSILKTSLQSAVNFCRRVYTVYLGHLFPLLIMCGQNAGKKIINVGYPSTFIPV